MPPTADPPKWNWALLTFWHFGIVDILAFFIFWHFDILACWHFCYLGILAFYILAFGHLDISTLGISTFLAIRFITVTWPLRSLGHYGHLAINVTVIWSLRSFGHFPPNVESQFCNMLFYVNKCAEYDYTISFEPNLPKWNVFVRIHFWHFYMFYIICILFASGS